MLTAKSSIDEAEQFIEEYSSLLHPNHYHMVAIKHQLMQMYGRTEGYLIQDMDEAQLKRKEDLCREHLEVLKTIDPHAIRLMIFAAAAHFELHMPLLQDAKRKWEAGKVSTEDFRYNLKKNIFDTKLTKITFVFQRGPEGPPQPREEGGGAAAE